MSLQVVDDGFSDVHVHSAADFDYNFGSDEMSREEVFGADNDPVTKSFGNDDSEFDANFSELSQTFADVSTDPLQHLDRAQRCSYLLKYGITHAQNFSLASVYAVFTSAISCMLRYRVKGLAYYDIPLDVPLTVAEFFKAFSVLRLTKTFADYISGDSKAFIEKYNNEYRLQVGNYNFSLELYPFYASGNGPKGSVNDDSAVRKLFTRCNGFTNFSHYCLSVAYWLARDSINVPGYVWDHEWNAVQAKYVKDESYMLTYLQCLSSQCHRAAPKLFHVKSSKGTIASMVIKTYMETELRRNPTVGLELCRSIRKAAPVTNSLFKGISEIESNRLYKCAGFIRRDITVVTKFKPVEKFYEGLIKSYRAKHPDSRICFVYGGVKKRGVNLQVTVAREFAGKMNIEFVMFDKDFTGINCCNLDSKISVQEYMSRHKYDAYIAHLDVSEGPVASMKAETTLTHLYHLVGCVRFLAVTFKASAFAQYDNLPGRAMYLKTADGDYAVGRKHNGEVIIALIPHGSERANLPSIVNGKTLECRKWLTDFITSNSTRGIVSDRCVLDVDTYAELTHTDGSKGFVTGRDLLHQNDKFLADKRIDKSHELVAQLFNKSRAGCVRVYRRGEKYYLHIVGDYSSSVLTTSLRLYGLSYEASLMSWSVPMMYRSGDHVLEINGLFDTIHTAPNFSNLDELLNEVDAAPPAEEVSDKKIIDGGGSTNVVKAVLVPPVSVPYPTTYVELKDTLGKSPVFGQPDEQKPKTPTGPGKQQFVVTNAMTCEIMNQPAAAASKQPSIGRSNNNNNKTKHTTVKYVPKRSDAAVASVPSAAVVAPVVINVPLMQDASAALKSDAGELEIDQMLANLSNLK